MAEETLSEVLYETLQHASGPCFPNYPPQQVNDTATTGISSLFSTRGLTQLKEKWTGYRQPKKLKRLVSLFVSPKGERVAVSVGNRITIVRKDEDYQQPYGIFASNNIGTFGLGVWSETHDVLGIVDDMDTLYFMKSNGEELMRIERRHLKSTLPIVGLFVPDVTETSGSLLCNFSFLTSDGTLHHIEISQDLSASLSSIRTWSDIKRQFSLNFFCSDYNLEHSLLVLVGGPINVSLTPSSSNGSCTLSVWRWSQKSDLLQVSSLQFEGVYSKPKGFRGLVVSPKVLISPHGKFIGTLDLRAHLNIFKLNVDSSSLSLFAYGETKSNFLEDIIDFTWWSNHVCMIAKKGGAVTMFDVISGEKLLDNDPLFSVPVLERPKVFLGKVFVLDMPLPRERQSSGDHVEISYIHDIDQYAEENLNQVETPRLSWKLLSFSEKSISEMYDVLINSQNYQSALDFADRYKLDKDQIFKSQWLHSTYGSDDVHMFLSNVKDEAFVLGECVERVGNTEDAVGALLMYGLNLTNRYKFSEPEYDRREHVWDLRLTRLQLLQFRDRLETFLGINMARFSVQEYSKFRIMPISEAAVKLAENGKIGALNLLFKRHPCSLSPFILQILAAIPETIQVQTYSQLLPGRSPPSITALREKDWVECEDMLEYIRKLPENDGRSVLVRTEPIIKQLFGILWPSTNEILIWYKERAKEIDESSGQLENSICLIDYGCRRGMYELQQFLDDISYLQQLVYSEGSDDELQCPISLAEWEDMCDYEKFRSILKGVKEENIVERLRVRAIPFMKSKLHLGGDDQEFSFLVRWLKETAAQNKIEFCSVVIDEWRRDVRSGFFGDEMDAAECALQCIYLCSAMDKWNTMASIVSKFPRGSDICAEGLEKRLKSAEGHIEAGRLLALYQVPKPVNFFLEAHNDDKAVKQILRLILSKFARRQPARSDNDWASMWRDLQCLQEKAFPFIDLEYMLMEFCRGLLKAGRFSLARNYLKGTGTVNLPSEKAESLVIQIAREFFFSASSLSSSEAFLWFLAYGSPKVHIVYMGERKHEEIQQVQDSHHQILANLLGSKEAAEQSILYSYKHGFSGFAAILTKSQAEVIADHPEVVAVVPNRVLRVQTTRSWDFLRVKSQLIDGILSKAHHGAGTTIGIIDTGIWPESKSFRDDGMEGVPSRWRGICQGGEHFNHSHCNKKIIGARWYIKGYEAVFGKLDRTVLPEYLSPRDAIGHGTHTASTAAGVFVKNAGFVTLAEGLARGGAPSAHLAVYKACWVDGTCIPADVLAAFDDAISDGVDVLSVSLTFPPPFYAYVSDPIAFGSFHATAKGIVVVGAAGNDGPHPQTVASIAPWIISVAASTTDRAFPSAITLGNNQTLLGQSLLASYSLNRFYPLVYGGEIATSLEAINCASGSLDTALAQGKVVLCFQSQSQWSSVVATETVRKARGAGLIFAQFPSKDVSLTSSFPTVLVDYTIGTSILNYIREARHPIVKFRPAKTVVGRQFSPEVASFSSRGPSSLSPQILKPDIAAPGANILAAWSPIYMLEPLSGLSTQNFRIASGTSMSCPHVSGIVALLKAVHLTWSPAAIKSAIITTASIKDRFGQPIVAEGFPHKVADAFDYGGGHIEPNKAIDPGLIFDMRTSDYIPFLCFLGYESSTIMSMTNTEITCQKEKDSLVHLNLPSISITELKNSLVVRRTVTNVGPALSIYKARVEAPAGVSVRVKPSILAFNSTIKKLKFKVAFTSLLRIQGRYSFGYLYWEDGFHVVRIPLVVRTVTENFYSDA